MAFCSGHTGVAIVRGEDDGSECETCCFAGDLLRNSEREHRSVVGAAGVDVASGSAVSGPDVSLFAAGHEFSVDGREEEDPEVPFWNRSGQ